MIHRLLMVLLVAVASPAARAGDRPKLILDAQTGGPRRHLILPESATNPASSGDAAVRFRGKP